MNITSIIVIFNHNTLILNKLLQSLNIQVNAVVICNNNETTLNKKDFVRLKIPLTILNFGENIGIASAQNRGIICALKSSTDAIITFDQDSYISSDFVMKITASYNYLIDNSFSVGLIGPLDVDPKDNNPRKPLLPNPYINKTLIRGTSSTLSSGSFIPRSSFEKVGFFLDELFIDSVDIEFCWRLKKHNLRVFIDDSILMPHHLGSQTLSLLGLRLIISSKLRYYYQFRNVIYLLLYKSPPFYWSLNMLLKLFIKLFLYPTFVIKDNKVFGLMIKGIYHGIIKKLGKFSV